jgi:hypothetical protein
MGWKSVSQASQLWLQSDNGRRAVLWSGRLARIGIFAFLGHELTQIGWGAVWRELPTAPTFYWLFLVAYFHQAVFCAWAYRLTWDIAPGPAMAACFKACLYNNEILGNSGDVYLYLWASRRSQLSKLTIVRAIKDNTVISSTAAYVVALSLPGVLYFCGQLAPGRTFDDREIAWLVGGLLAGAGLVVAGTLFHSVLFSVSRRAFAKMALIYFGRVAFIIALTVGQWAVAIPTVPWHAWLTMVALQRLFNLIPLLPANDILFIAAGAELAPHLGVQPAAMASVLLATAAIGKIMNLAMFSGLAWLEGRGLPGGGRIEQPA